jgi:hypothetical protein
VATSGSVVDQATLIPYSTPPNHFAGRGQRDCAFSRLNEIGQLTYCSKPKRSGSLTHPTQLLSQPLMGRSSNEDEAHEVNRDRSWSVAARCLHFIQLFCMWCTALPSQVHENSMRQIKGVEDEQVFDFNGWQRPAREHRINIGQG